MQLKQARVLKGTLEGRLVDVIFPLHIDQDGVVAALDSEGVGIFVSWHHLQFATKGWTAR